MKIAVMQPYFFPYIGYWQLIHAVDLFVVYDDVNYIKRGWVNRNRNRILINGAPAYLTSVLDRASQNRRICDTRLHRAGGWRGKIAKTLDVTYARAPFFSEVFPVVESLLRHDTDNLAEYLTHQLRTLASLMSIGTRFTTSSQTYPARSLSGAARVTDICRQSGSDTYINPCGGMALYDADAFRAAGVDLRFLKMRPIPYRQRCPGFMPFLSIIDALMEVGPTGIRQHLDAFDLLGPDGAEAGH